MKRFSVFPYFLVLAMGLLVGILLPIDLLEEEAPLPAAPSNGAFTTPNISGSQSEAPGSSSPGAEQEPLNPTENFPLLNAACAVNRAIQRQDYTVLASYIHPSRGVTFTPYSTVDFNMDITFTPDQVKNLPQDQTVYTWGIEDGRGDPIQMTAMDYFARYVYDADYTQATEIGIDRIMTGGNALENLADAYPGCRYVDFSFPSADPVNDGLDWSSLKLVFQPEDDLWYLVGVVHGEWTI